MVRFIFRVLARGIWVALTSAGLTGQAALDKNVLQVLRNVHQDAVTAVSETYYPPGRVDADFQQKMTAVSQALEQAKSPNHACVLIADAFKALDPGIRIYLFPHTSVMDYGWSWQLVGNTAFVTQLDADSDARRQGLKRGDQIISINGLPINRGSHRIINYALQVIVPRDKLHVIAQSPGEQPRELSLAARNRSERTIRLANLAGLDRSTQKLNLSPLDKKRLEEFLTLDRQLRNIGEVVVWRASHLNREVADVRKALARLQSAKGLIIDVRGEYIFRHDTVIELLSGLLEQKAEIGRIERKKGIEPLGTSGGGSFRGPVLVLIDSATAGYAELLARVIQQEQRGVVLGDRSMGQVQEEAMTGYQRTFRPSDYNTTVLPMLVDPVSGATAPRVIRDAAPAIYEAGTWVTQLSDIVYDPAAPIYGIRLPIGRVVLADGSILQGTGVTPDHLVLPTAADLAGQRDIVLAQALAMLKQPTTPEDAYKLFRNDWDDDELILDHTILY